MEQTHSGYAGARVAQSAVDTALVGPLRAVARAALAVALAATLLLALVGLSGCGKSQAAQQSLETTLAAIQAADTEEISTYLSAVAFDPELYSVSMAAFVAVRFADFSYHINDATENSDGTVTITVEMKSRSNAEVLALMRGALDGTYASETLSASTETISADATFIGLAEGYAWDTYANTYTIIMSKADSGEWRVSDAGLFGAILLDGYDPRQLSDSE